jgi:hypothetical protein
MRAFPVLYFNPEGIALITFSFII